MATYDLTSTTPTSLAVGDILNCPYSGTYKTITLPAGTFKLECWGAQGGYRSSSTYGGLGGYSYGTLTLSLSTLLYLYSGGSGGNSSTSTGSVVAGGFNGGGYRYGYKGGGGGSDIRISSTSLYSRVIVAGGGGSDGASSKTGMYGGGTSGGSSTQSYTSYSDYCGKGGTQTYSGYSSSYTATTQVTTGLTSQNTDYYGGFWFGGSGVTYANGFGGAGGGGWYGGSGTVPDSSADDDRGGGGGSGYVYTSSTYSNYPSGCTLNSTYYLSDASTIAGNTSFTDYSGSTVTGHSGDGAIRITILTLIQNLNLYVNIGGTWKQASKLYTNINGTWKESSIKSNISGTWK
jgi:hypothetical protein